MVAIDFNSALLNLALEKYIFAGFFTGKGFAEIAVVFIEIFDLLTGGDAKEDTDITPTNVDTTPVDD